MAHPAVKARESPNKVTVTGGPVYIEPLGVGTVPAASAVDGRVAATVTATTPKNAALVINQAFHSVSDRILPRRIGCSTR
jgi:hypothetical protein